MANGVRQIDISLIIMMIGIILIGCIVGFAITKVMPIFVLGGHIGSYDIYSKFYMASDCLVFFGLFYVTLT